MGSLERADQAQAREAVRAGVTDRARATATSNRVSLCWRTLGLSNKSAGDRERRGGMNTRESRSP